MAPARALFGAMPGTGPTRVITDKAILAANDHVEDLVVGRSETYEFLQLPTSDGLPAPLPRLLVHVQPERSITEEGDEALAARDTQWS